MNNGAWTGFSVAGKRQETNRFLINGLDYVGGNSTGQFITPSGSSGQLLGVEAVREYNVLQDTYGAEYGKRAGGQISIVTSAGTNQLHGDMFEYLRNSALDARNFLDQTIGAPPFKRNQFGGALGGPLKKDKMFLFGNYEGFRQRLATSGRAIVPDNFARLGLSPSGAAIPNLNKGMLPFVNAFWPAPNGPEQGLSGVAGTAFNFSNALQSVREDFGMSRFDYIVSAKDTFSANYTIDNGDRAQPDGDPNFISLTEQHAQGLGLQETHIFSPNLVNVATAGYARALGTLVRAPAVSIPTNLLFLAGGNPGSIIIGGGTTTVAAAGIAAADGINPVQGVRNYFTWADDLHWTKGKHSWSAGVWIQRVQQNLFGAAQSSAGSASYATLTTFLQDVPTAVQLNRNPIPIGFRSLEAAWYIQDEIKLRPNLTVRVGLRDEMTNGWNEVANRCSNYQYDANFIINRDPTIGSSCLATNSAKALWQPRVGLAWDPTGNGTWAVRAAFGIHNDLQDNLGNRSYGNPPFNARETLGVSNGLLRLIPLQRTAALPPTCSPTQGQPCSTYAPGGVDPNLFTPTIQQWTFTVERQLTRNLMLSVGYVGSQSYHTPLSIDTNTAAPQVCASQQGCRSGGVLAANQAATVPLGTTYMPSTPPKADANGTLLTLRPNPYVAQSVAWYDQGTSSYHSLNVTLLKRATHGLSFKANYTYGKVIDLNSAVLAPSGENEPPDVYSPYNLSMNRGVASYSIHHQFNANFGYQLPFGKGQHFASGAGRFVDTLIGGWQWNGITTIQGGFPFTPIVGFNSSGTGDPNQSDVPNWNPNFKGPVILGSPNQWFDPHAFAVPTAGTFGNLGRGSLRGPGLVDFDTSFFKRIKINERLNLQFRAEAFNLFNHVNLSYANPVVFSGNNASYSISSSAGVPTAALVSRQIQFALKLIF
jgi:hypothetical protein